VEYLAHLKILLYLIVFSLYLELVEVEHILMLIFCIMMDNSIIQHYCFNDLILYSKHILDTYYNFIQDD